MCLCVCGGGCHIEEKLSGACVRLFAVLSRGRVKERARAKERERERLMATWHRRPFSFSSPFVCLSEKPPPPSHTHTYTHWGQEDTDRSNRELLELLPLLGPGYTTTLSILRSVLLPSLFWGGRNTRKRKTSKTKVGALAQEKKEVGILLSRFVFMAHTHRRRRRRKNERERD